MSQAAPSAWFLSDLHLKDINERNAVKLIGFLSDLESGVKPCTKLYLLGDIFDLWIGDHEFFYQKFRPIIDLISQIKQKGADVYYFEGNHDVHVKNFWQARYDIPCFTEAQYFDFDDFRIRAEHGDQMNLEDLPYLRLRKFVRFSALEKLAYSLPGGFWNELGTKASQVSRHFSTKKRRDRQEEIRQIIRNHAHRVYSERKFDLIVSGHMHVRDEFDFRDGEKTIKSVNLGSWFDQPQVLQVLLQGKQFQTHWHQL